MELSHHHVFHLHLPFFDQPQSFSVVEKTLSLKYFHMLSIKIIYPVIHKKIV